MEFETLAVHAGRTVDPTSGAVMPPITLSTTFARDGNGGLPSGYIYTRSSNPNRAQLETALAVLEAGKTALAFSSGQAALAAVLHALNPGDHLLYPVDLYHGTRNLIQNEFARWGLRADAVEMSDLEQVAAAWRPETRLIWVETPSNPQLRISDIQAIAELAHAHGAICAVDNTWATPVWQTPLTLGADLVMHSTTKYLGGHSDVLGGAVIWGESLDASFADRLSAWQNLGGAVPSPFDCWLLLRSLATLPYRVRAQTEHAGRITEYLAGRKDVVRIHYPGLREHPAHDLAARQMRGFGGMLSFEVEDAARAMRLASAVRLFLRATSLGGVESLIEHRASVEGPGSPTPAGLLRVSIGLEHPDDLLADLAAALDASV